MMMMMTIMMMMMMMMMAALFLQLLINGYGIQYNGMDLKLKVILTYECGQ